MRRSFATRCTCKLVLSLVTTKARGSGSFYHCYRIRGHQRLPMPINSRQESRFIQRLRGCILRSCAAGFDHVAVTSVASLETYHQLLMTQSHLGISPGSLRMSDGCGKLHDAARTYAPGHLLRQYLSSRRLKPTSAPLNLSPVGNGTSKFLLLSKVFVHSRSLITYGLITSQRPASSLSCTSFQTMFSGSLLSFLRVEPGVCTPESSSKAPTSDRCPTSGRLSAANSSSSIELGSSSPKRCCDGNISTDHTSTADHNLPSTKR